jgi:hypothetical protein
MLRQHMQQAPAALDLGALALQIMDRLRSLPGGASAGLFRQLTCP